MSSASTFNRRVPGNWWRPLALAMLLGFTAMVVADDNAPTDRKTPQLSRDELREPVQVLAKDGRLEHQLNAVFGRVKIRQPEKPVEVNVRVYGIPDAKNQLFFKDTKPAIPGPTFVFHPGDLLKIRFHNYLNASQNPKLNRFDNTIQEGGPGTADDIREHVAHEISIPNNSDLTNLHVHGLHVDPKQDNVTLLILPEDNSPADLSIQLQRLVPTINRWWYRPYQYKIPRDHIPGTYWYHSHKHGSTSTQVENGMAGTLLMLPQNDRDSVVPGLWNDDPAKTHDRVLMIQEIANYGVPKAGKKPRRVKPPKDPNVPQPPNNINTPIVTINGQFLPTLKLPPNQLERWRFIFAGANHTAAGSLWVGKIVLPPMPPQLAETIQAINESNYQQYIPAKMGAPAEFFPVSLPAITYGKIPGAVKMIALDGIPMRAPVDIAPATPSLSGAGNRVDLLIQPDKSAASTGPYFVYQNYPAATLAELALAYPKLFGANLDPKLVQARYSAFSQGQVAGPNNSSVPAVQLQPTTDVAGNAVPNSLNQDTYALGTSYWTFTKNWANVGPNGDPSGGFATLPVGPLLQGVENDVTNGVDVALPDAKYLEDFTQGRFQPMPDDPSVGGAQPPTAAAIMALDISGIASGPQMPKDLDARVSALSPAGMGTALKKVNKLGQLVPGIPAYVAPLPEKVDGSQVVVFDRGEFTFDYFDKVTAQLLKFRQFWITGRQFDVDDFVGNPISTDLIQSPIKNVAPDLGVYNPNGAHPTWTHQIAPAVGNAPPQILVTNPAYFRTIKNYANEGQTPSYNYDYDQASYKAPTYKSITGLNQAPTPPKSRTSEEWLLVNNSDLYHPFHIHISPFFVEEVGQLNYAPSESGPETWSIKKTVWDAANRVARSEPASPQPPKFGWVVGNWWDVIMLPPHGYVKMKTWINVPDQVPVDGTNENSDLAVLDNSNVYGSWVLHCHILRHEDRGMMSMVNTVPNPAVLGGTQPGQALSWYDGQTGNAATYEVVDHHGDLNVKSSQTDVKPFIGTFNQGLGNPFVTLPWAGAMNFASGVATFCVTDDTNLIQFSDGQQWVKSDNPPPYPAPNNEYIDLSGTWIDDSQNQATIKQTQGQTLDPTTNVEAVVGILTVTPVTNPKVEPVWWTAGSGTWNAGQWTTTTMPKASTANLAYGGKLVHSQLKVVDGKLTVVRNQVLSFCVSTDGKTIVFSNGIKWSKQ